MKVTVRLFALARQHAGRPEVTLDLPEPVTIAALKRALASAYPDLAPMLPRLLIAVAAEYAPDDFVIPPGAEVAAIPPVSGGSPNPNPQPPTPNPQPPTPNPHD